MHSALWSILQQILRQILVALFIFLIASRVSPAEFGLVGLANIWNTALYLFLELAFAAGLVQRRHITPAHVSTAFLLNLAAGSLILLLAVSLAAPVSRLLNAPEAEPIIVTLSLSFLITAALSTPLALAQRNLQFKALAVRDFIANVISILFGVALALRGFGVWAVVFSSLLLNLINATLIWRLSSSPILICHASWSAARDLWSYGASVFSATALKYILRTADSFLVGFLFGPEELGLYNFSQRVAHAPTKGLHSGLAAFLFPKSARLQDHPESLRELFLLSFKALNYILLLFSLMLVSVGTQLLLALFGAQWQPALHFIRILVLVQLIAPAVVPMSELLKAAGHPGWLLVWTSSLTLLSSLALIFGSRFDFQASVIGSVAAHFLTLPIALALVRKITGLGLLEFWRRLRLCYFLLALTALAMLPIWTFSRHHLPLLVAASSLLGVACLLAAWRWDPDLRRIPQLLPILRRRPPPHQSEISNTQI